MITKKFQSNHLNITPTIQSSSPTSIILNKENSGSIL